MNKVIMILSLIFLPLPVSLSICYALKNKDNKKVNIDELNRYMVERPVEL